MQLKPGTRLFGACCTSEFVVVSSPSDDVDVRIGGHPALASVAERSDDHPDVTTPPEAKPQMGKRYVNTAGTVELLCTKPGTGAAGVGEEILVIKDAKPLPASD